MVELWKSTAYKISFHARYVFKPKILISLDMRIVWYVFIDIISVYILWHSIWYKFMAVWFINVTMPIPNSSFSRIYFSMESENLYTFTAAINLAYCSLFSLMISIQAFYKLLVHLFCDLYAETYNTLNALRLISDLYQKGCFLDELLKLYKLELNIFYYTDYL